MAKGKAGTHTTVIDPAKPLVATLEAHGRVSRGIITPRAGSSSHTIKINPQKGAHRITLVAKNAKQEFHAYGIPLEKLRCLLQTHKNFRNYHLLIAKSTHEASGQL